MFAVRTGLGVAAGLLGFGVLCAAIPQTGARAQERSSNLAARLESAATRAAENADLPDLTVGVWIAEDAVLSKAIALEKRVDASAIERERDALWALEPLCGVALLRMADAEHLSTSDLLTKHLPALKFAGAHVTVAQVLTHTSGAPSYVDVVTTKPDLKDSASVLAWLGARSLDSDAGSCFAYSPSNALIAAALVEKLSGEPLATALKTWVLTPAGLEATTIETGASASRVREASFRVGGESADATLLAQLVDVARITTTAPDLAQLLRALQGDELLSQRGRATLIAADRLPNSVDAPYAYGFARSRMDREPFLSIGGAASTGATHLAWRPDAQLVVALTSSEHDARLAPIAERLARVVFDVAERVIVDLPLNAEQRAIYTGVYYMGCTRTTIEARDEALYFQSPYDGPYRLRFQGDHRFVAEHDDATELEFRVEHDRATEFVILRHGSRTGAKRME